MECGHHHGHEVEATEHAHEHDVSCDHHHDGSSGHCDSRIHVAMKDRVKKESACNHAKNTNISGVSAALSRTAAF